VVQPAETKFNLVRPLLTINNDKSWSAKYTRSDGYAPMDTIGNIPFSLPIDTFLRYLVIDNQCTYKFKWVDNTERPELKYGDIIEISAPTGDKKEYKICVNEYAPGTESLLKAIIFPGTQLFTNHNFEPTDSLSPFDENRKFYSLKLPEGTQTMPGMIAVPKDNKAKVLVKRATNLYGSEQDRTATITVTADDDSIKSVYTILFEVDRETPPVVGEPFYTDYSNAWGNRTRNCLQIFNPKDERISLEDYVFVKIPKNFTSLAAFGANWLNDDQFVRNNENILRPGYIVKPSVTLGNKPVFTSDLAQTTTTLEPRSTYSIIEVQSYPLVNGNKNADGSWNLNNIALKDKVDFPLCQINTYASTAGYVEYRTYKGLAVDPYGFGKSPFSNCAFDYTGATNMILKIKSDSVKDGLISVAEDFLDNKLDYYEIVDIVNGLSTQSVEYVLYDNNKVLKMKQTPEKVYGIIRKSSVYTGNPVERMSFGFGDTTTTIVPSEWEWYGFDQNGSWLKNDEPLSTRTYGKAQFENHIMNTAAHIPYIFSNEYIASTGLSTSETLVGVLPNTTVASFFSKIIKPDAKMKIELKSAGDVIKTDGEIVAEGDKLVSTAANGKTSVTYIVKIGALSDDMMLASTKYTVSADKPAQTGLVANVPFGITVTAFLADLQKPASAKVSLLDGMGQVIPAKRTNSDTMLIKTNTLIDVVLPQGAQIEVIAQNGTSKCLYNVSFAKPATPYILSDVYVVNQSLKMINYIGSTTVSVFLHNIKAAPGCSVKVVNKMNQPRTTGIVQFDDKLIVTAEDGNTTAVYDMQFTYFDAVAKTGAKKLVQAMPNPTDGMFRLSGLDHANRITVLGINGQTILTRVVTGQSADINLSKQSAGVYLVKITNNNGSTENLKVIKQ